MVKSHIFVGAIVLVVAIVAIYFFLPKGNFGLGTDKMPALTGATSYDMCADSDGTNSFTKGVTLSLADKKSHTDYCVTANSVMEGSCNGDNLRKEQVQCGKSCVDGACLK